MKNNLSENRQEVNVVAMSYIALAAHSWQMDFAIITYINIGSVCGIFRRAFSWICVPYMPHPAAVMVQVLRLYVPVCKILVFLTYFSHSRYLALVWTGLHFPAQGCHRRHIGGPYANAAALSSLSALSILQVVYLDT
jgi:hypothetical protein